MFASATTTNTQSRIHSREHTHIDSRPPSVTNTTTTTTTADTQKPLRAAHFHISNQTFFFSLLFFSRPLINCQRRLLKQVFDDEKHDNSNKNKQQNSKTLTTLRKFTAFCNYFSHSNTTSCCYLSSFCLFVCLFAFKRTRMRRTK